VLWRASRLARARRDFEQTRSRRPNSAVANAIGAGKTTFFVPNQAKIDTLAPERIAEMEKETKEAEEDNKARAAQVKAAVAGEFSAYV
jgi:hypothetical protein